MGQGGSSNRTEVSTIQTKQDDGISWWMKILARSVGVIGGLVAIIAGIMSLITFSPICLVAGILLMLLGFMCILFEAPCFCQMFDFTDVIARFIDRRTLFQKAFIYCIVAIFPLALCFSLSVLFGSGLIFATGTLYGLMGLGRKSDLETMKARARGDIDMKEQLIEEGENNAASSQP